MQKQIEEMAKIIGFSHCGIQAQHRCTISCDICIAEELYNAGYTQKVKDDEVVISKEEYEKLKKHYSFMQDYTIVEVLEKECEKANKETAREILQALWETTEPTEGDEWIRQEIKQLAEKYGVEVE